MHTVRCLSFYWHDRPSKPRTFFLVPVFLFFSLLYRVSRSDDKIQRLAEIFEILGSRTTVDTLPQYSVFY